MAGYDIFPGMDSGYNFPPAVRAALGRYDEIRGAITAPAGFDANSVDDNIPRVINASSQATNLPPGVTAGLLETYVLIPTSFRPKFQRLTTTGMNPEMHTRFSGSGGWSGWTRIDAGGVSIPEINTPVSDSAASYRSVPLALTVGGSITDFETSSGGVRIPIKYSRRIRRWRLHIRNINPREGVAQSATVTIGAVRFGTAKTDDLKNFATHFQIASNLSGSGDITTPWQNSTIEPNVDHLIAFSWTSTAPPKKVVGGGWTTGGGSTDFYYSTAATTAASSLPLDCWIEAEVEADVPIVAVFGDSLSSGVGATTPVYDSWLSQWCRANQALPVHYTASGDTMSGWSNSKHYKWTRWQNLSRPDSVIHAMGSNDVFGGASLDDLKSRRAQTVDILRTLVSNNIYTATILPRSGVTGTSETTRRSYNAWLKTLPDSARDWFDFVPAVSTNDEDISPSFTTDNIHLTKPGYAALANTIVRPLYSSVVDWSAAIASLNAAAQ